jgi:hypothetical protein
MDRVYRLAPGLLFLCWCGLPGCWTIPATAPTEKKPVDPLVQEILKSDNRDKKVGVNGVDPDVILKEIPLQTPVAKARSIMEKHGFSCWAGVPADYRICLDCRFYKQKNSAVADMIQVKLYYDNNRISGVDVTVNGGVSHSDHGLWPW